MKELRKSANKLGHDKQSSGTKSEHAASLTKSRSEPDRERKA